MALARAVLVVSEPALTAPPGTLDAVLQQTWVLLARGVGDPTCAAHLPALATCTVAGEPGVRTVVLRAFEATTRTLTFCTDRRSAKCTEIARTAAGSVHLYDPASLVQLRLGCRLTLHADDAVAGEQWRQTPPDNRLLYRVRQAPGTAIDNPCAALPDDALTEHEGRANFAVIVARVEWLDWLLLDDQGHRRALFDWRGNTEYATWLVA